MAEPITFTGAKLKLLDEQRKNAAISDLDFRVLHAIVAAIDRRTEQAVRTREQLALAAGGKHIRTVERSIGRWVARKVITVKRSRGRGHANIYRLLLEKADGAPPFQDVAGGENATALPPLSGAEKAAQLPLKGGAPVREKAAGVPPPPFLYPERIPSARGGARVPQPTQPEHAAGRRLSDGDKNEGWWIEPYSPEFDAWSAYYDDEGWIKAKREMISCAQRGESVRVPSQWPPCPRGCDRSPSLQSARGSRS